MANALRKKPITTTILTNEVVMIKTAGVIETIVKSAITCKVDETFSGESAAPSSTLTLGSIDSAPAALVKANNAISVKPKYFNFAIKSPVDG